MWAGRIGKDSLNRVLMLTPNTAMPESSESETKTEIKKRDWRKDERDYSSSPLQKRKKTETKEEKWQIKPEMEAEEMLKEEETGRRRRS